MADSHRPPGPRAREDARLVCRNCLGTGTWHDIVWDCERACPCEPEWRIDRRCDVEDDGSLTHQPECFCPEAL